MPRTVCLIDVSIFRVLLGRVGVGTATLFDHAGPFGSGTVTAISNPAAQIDFADDPFPLRGPTA